MYEVPAKITFHREQQHVNLTLAKGVIGYYRWFLMRKYGWIHEDRLTFGLQDNDEPQQDNSKKPPKPLSGLLEPLYEAHVTVVARKHHRFHKGDYERLRRKYNGRPAMVGISPRMNASYSKKRGGFWTFTLPVWSDEAVTLQDEFRVPKNRRKWLHMTVANTKKS